MGRVYLFLISRDQLTCRGQTKSLGGSVPSGKELIKALGTPLRDHRETKAGSLGGRHGCVMTVLCMTERDGEEKTLSMVLTQGSWCEAIRVLFPLGKGSVFCLSDCSRF